MMVDLFPKDRLLKLVADQINNCTECELCKDSGKKVPGEGNRNAEIVLCGEAPGAKESELGIPFVGRAGKLLDNMIKAMGYKREDLYILNTVKCRPPNNRNPEPAEIESCAKYLDMQLQIIDPFLIIALGAVASDRLLSETVGQSLSSRRGKIHSLCIDKSRYNVICTYHPAYLLRNPAAKAEAHKDLTLVKNTIDEWHAL